MPEVTACPEPQHPLTGLPIHLFCILKPCWYLYIAWQLPKGHQKVRCTLRCTLYFSEMYFPNMLTVKCKRRDDVHVNLIKIKPLKEKAHTLHRPGSKEDVDLEAPCATWHGHFTSYSLGLHIYLTNTKCLLWARTSLRYNYPYFTAEEREA